MLVVGEIPSEIRISREQYIGLLARLEAAVHGTCPHESEMAYELLDQVRPWLGLTHGRGQDGQLELPLEWPERATR